MSIKIEQFNAKVEQQDIFNASSKTATTEKFEEALAYELRLKQSENNPLSDKAPALGSKVNTVEQLFLTKLDGDSDAQRNHDSMVQSAIIQTSGVLNTWETYVNELSKKDGQVNLRDAYAHLQGLSGQIDALKQNSKQLLDQSPDLANIVEELDVMRVTETFKFNRGDYA